MDPFLRHATIYALFEIGDVRSLPTGHPLEKQVRLMREIEGRKVAPGAYPEIRLAKVNKPEPDKPEPDDADDAQDDSDPAADDAAPDVAAEAEPEEESAVDASSPTDR